MLTHFTSTRPARRSFLIVFLLLCVLTLSCKTKKEQSVEPAADPVPPEFTVLPANFHPLGGLVENFNFHFDKLGNMPIDEYGIVYAFLPKQMAYEPLYEPIGEGGKVAFKTPAKVGDVQEIAKVGFPSNSHYLVYRAYVKLKGDGKEGSIVYSQMLYSVEF